MWRLSFPQEFTQVFCEENLLKLLQYTPFTYIFLMKCTDVEMKTLGFKFKVTNVLYNATL